MTHYDTRLVTLASLQDVDYILRRRQLVRSGRPKRRLDVVKMAAPVLGPFQLDFVRARISSSSVAGVAAAARSAASAAATTSSTIPVAACVASGEAGPR